MNPYRITWFAALIAVILIVSCAPRHHVTFQVVTKDKSTKVYHNSDGVYYTQDNGLWMVYMMNMGGSSHVYSSVTYSGADRFTSVSPDFSKGSFVPVAGQSGLTNPTSSDKSFAVRGDEPVGSGGFGGKFDTERDAKTEQVEEAPEETIETEQGTEVTPTEAESAESADTGGDSTSGDSTSNGGDSGGDSGGGGGGDD